MSPFIKSGKSLGEIEEEQIVPEGEYELRIFAAQDRMSKAGDREITLCSIAVEDPNFPNAQPITHVLTLPSESDWEENPRMAENFMRRNKRFLALFNAPHTDQGWEAEDLVSCTAKAFVGVSTEDEEGNVYNRIRVPRLKV